MCFRESSYEQWRQTIAPRHKPDCHLVLEVLDVGARVQALVDALLRVDLGARIKPDPVAGTIDIEGRFRKEDVAEAVRRLGLHLARMEVKAPSLKAPGRQRMTW